MHEHRRRVVRRGFVVVVGVLALLAGCGEPTTSASDEPTDAATTGPTDAPTASPSSTGSAEPTASGSEATEEQTGGGNGTGEAQVQLALQWLSEGVFETPGGAEDDLACVFDWAFLQDATQGQLEWTAGWHPLRDVAFLCAFVEPNEPVTLRIESAGGEVLLSDMWRDSGSTVACCAGRDTPYSVLVSTGSQAPPPMAVLATASPGAAFLQFTFPGDSNLAVPGARFTVGVGSIQLAGQFPQEGGSAASYSGTPPTETATPSATPTPSGGDAPTDTDLPSETTAVSEPPTTSDSG